MIRRNVSFWISVFAISCMVAVLIWPKISSVTSRRDQSPSPDQASPPPRKPVPQFYALKKAIEHFREEYGYYPNSLQEAWERPGGYRSSYANLEEWIYSPDKPEDSYRLQHVKYEDLRRIDPPDRTAVEEALTSPSEFLRRQATYCVASAFDSADLLLDVIRKDPSAEVRRRALYGLDRLEARGILSATEARSVIIEALLDPEPRVGNAAAGVLVRSASDFVAHEVITWAESENRDQRLQCARALADFDDDARWEPLGKLLQDPEPAVRISAARSLVRWGQKCPQWIKDRLISVMRADDEREIRVECARTAAELGFNEGIPILARSLMESDSVDETVASIAALGNLDSHDSRNILREFLSHRNERVRRAAVGSLGRFKYPGRCQDVAPLLEDPVADIRGRVIEIVRSCTDDWVIPRLLERFEDEDFEVRTEAVMAFGGVSVCFCPWHTTPTRLASLKDPRTVQPLRRALKDPDEPVRLAAAIALSQYRLPETADAMIAALTDTASWRYYGRACDHVGYALVEMGIEVPVERIRDYVLISEPGVPHVCKSLTENHPEKEKLKELLHEGIPVRLESKDEKTLVGALTALSVFHMTEFDEAVIELSKHPASIIRWAAINALEDNTSHKWRERLSDLLNDPKRHIRDSASRQLERIQRTNGTNEEKKQFDNQQNP